MVLDERNINENSDDSEPIQNSKCHCDYECNQDRNSECATNACVNKTSINEGHGFFKLPNMLLLMFFSFIIFYFGYIVFKAIDIKIMNIDLSGVEKFSTVFVSLIMQAVPFLMAGTVLSAIIQIFVSEERLVRMFPKNGILAFFSAIFSGFFIPLCDCAVVPVAARLIKKGVSVPAAVTFMLASPIINPITIAATLYAFPERPEFAFIRVYLGITIALAVGIVLRFLPEKNSVLLKNKFEVHCSCSHCDGASEVDGKVLNRIKSVLLHSSDEFFNVGRFLIVGAVVSSLVQVAFPKEWLTGLAGSPLATVVAMMLAAFLMSVCSTADAFIARSFATTVPMQGVMSFMVLGPLLDVKNVLMMTGCFTKRFVVKLALIIMGLGFSILFIVTNLIYG